MKLNLSIIKEGEVIVKLPRNLLPDLEIMSKEKGFKNSREFLAHFIKKQFALYYNTDKDDYRLKDIH